MSMMGGKGMDPFGKMDIRIVMTIMAAFISLCLAAVGDAGVFRGQPENLFQSVVSLVTVLSWNLSGDRATTFGMTAIIFFSVIAGIGAVVFQTLAIHVIEPMMIKKKLSQMKREKEIINKLDDNII